MRPIKSTSRPEDGAAPFELMVRRRLATLPPEFFVGGDPPPAYSVAKQLAIVNKIERMRSALTRILAIPDSPVGRSAGPDVEDVNSIRATIERLEAELVQVVTQDEEALINRLKASLAEIEQTRAERNKP